MSTDTYSEYIYKRNKRPSRRMFRYVVLVFVLVLAIMAANLHFKFITFSRAAGTERVQLVAWSFYTTESGSYSNKAEALKASQDIKAKGGAGFVTSMGVSGSDAWRILEAVHQTEEAANQALMADGGSESATVKKYTCPAAELVLVSVEDKPLIEEIAKSFEANIEKIAEQLVQYDERKLSRAEIMDLANKTYQGLRKTVGELEVRQETVSSPYYAKLINCATQQLVAVYTLSVDAGNDNFASVMRYSMCQIAFAYYQLVV